MNDKGENRIILEDNRDRETSEMSENKEQEQPQTQSSGSWYEKPEGMGNAAGEWIQDKLNPVGHYTGKGLEQVGRPVGGIVDPIVGGIMRGGEAFGNQLGVGYGNKEGGPAKQEEKEGERMKQPVGGGEQTADNPLGLNRSA